MEMEKCYKCVTGLRRGRQTAFTSLLIPPLRTVYGRALFRFFRMHWDHEPMRSLVAPIIGGRIYLSQRENVLPEMRKCLETNSCIFRFLESSFRFEVRQCFVCENPFAD